MSMQVESVAGKIITLKFPRITNRKFEEALCLLEDAREENNRKKKIELSNQAFEILVGGSEVLDECTRGDVDAVLAAAVKFHQTPQADQKKSD